eukprot:6001067-Amphidinium_carterae.1
MSAAPCHLQLSKQSAYAADTHIVMVASSSTQTKIRDRDDDRGEYPFSTTSVRSTTASCTHSSNTSSHLFPGTHDQVDRPALRTLRDDD